MTLQYRLVGQITEMFVPAHEFYVENGRLLPPLSPLRTFPLTLVLINQ